MGRSVPVAEAKASFSGFLREAERGETVVITRHGKPVAALVPTEDVERLRRLHRAGPEKGLASVAGGWKGSDGLARSLDGLRRRSRPVASARR